MASYFDLLSQRNDAEAFEPGEPIYRETEPGSVGFFLLEGEVTLEKTGLPNEPVTPGQLFGQEALLGEPRRTDTARARTAALVVPIGPALYEHLVHADARIAWGVRAAQRRRERRIATAGALLFALAGASAFAQAPRTDLGALVSDDFELATAQQGSN